MRRHAVLVPGFVGFDALGQIPYYACVSGILRACRREATAGESWLSVHYFDNYPTASVAVRARQLRGFLAKRVARGEFAPGDRVVLIGHSTGGLDIRRLLLDLTADRGAATTVDVDCTVGHAELLSYIDRLVFLSVPHYGTRLADVSGPLDSWMQGFASDAAEAMARNRGWRARLRQRLIAGRAQSAVGLLRALHQALDDSDELDDSASAQATARTARLEWVAWLEHMAHDLSALADLGTRAPPGRKPADRSPAHFDQTQRAAELSEWPAQLTTRSYVTLVDASQVHPPRAVRALTKGLVEAADRRWLGRGLSAAGTVSHALPLPNAASVATLMAGLLEWLPKAPFELFHTACAAAEHPLSRPPSLPATIEQLGDAPPRRTSKIAPTDNDGVVNTLSMLWPYEADRPERHTFVLVEADHGDIIGHGPTFHDGVSRKRSYDLLQSPQPIRPDQLEAVWRDIYAFASAA